MISGTFLKKKVKYAWKITEKKEFIAFYGGV